MPQRSDEWREMPAPDRQGCRGRGGSVQRMSEAISSIHIFWLRKTLVHDNYHFLKNLSVLFFMMFGASGNVNYPLNPWFVTSDPPNYSHYFKRNPNSCSHILCFDNVISLKNEAFGKGACQKMPEVGLIKSWRSWIWHHYLQTTWNGNFNIFESN